MAYTQGYKGNNFHKRQYMISEDKEYNKSNKKYSKGQFIRKKNMAAIKRYKIYTKVYNSHHNW